MDSLKEKYFDAFKVQFGLLKNYSPDESNETIFSKTLKVTTAMTSIEPTPVWTVQLHKEYVGMFTVNNFTTLKNEETEDWYNGERKENRFFWGRYQQFLAREKEWPHKPIENINNTTDEIMNSIGNPQSSLPFDKRGLVLGYVQSGKTANFTGLINKAYDAGYKLIIVLSGIHNDLRAQTQLRLESEVAGINSQGKFQNEGVGVSKIIKNDSNHFIHLLTTIDKDISSQSSLASYNLKNNRTLMVVKKNSTVLESLYVQLKMFLKQINSKVPVLIVDDEADQASIDTSTAGEASTINKLIRQILELFDQKAYVGYTATPFANLLINSQKETVKEGLDLYPKDFMIGLPKADGYCGPDEFFNTDEDAENQQPSLIIELEKADIDMFSGIKKPEHADKFTDVPPQMLQAIKSFIIVTTIRSMREHKNSHNSMLIHTSRFKDVQSSIKDEVEKAFEEIVTDIKLNQNGSTIKSLYDLYMKEFVDKTIKWNQAKKEDNKIFTWEEIYSEMKGVVEKINVMEINGNSKDALEYNHYKEVGLNVIAVGGDKLSRGLTLEGLTISYYYRNTMMYDTLMQMGRWFGFRTGYLDLCRIYTSPAIASNFEHLALAMKELREEFDKLKGTDKTPLDYAVKMLSHPSMTLTSPLKMKGAVTATTIYRNTLQQTRIFGLSETFYKTNMKAAENLIEKVQDKISVKYDEKNSSKYKYHIADQVPAKLILEFLEEYQTKSESKVNAQRISNYISTISEKFNELYEWKVAVVEGVPGKEVPPVKLGKLEIQYTVSRGMGIKSNYSNYTADTLDIKAIVAAGQEFFYLKDVDPDKEKQRKQLPRNKGVLMIYPLNPATKAFESIDKNFNEKFNKGFVPIGIAFSFPDSEIDDSLVYQVNKALPN